MAPYLPAKFLWIEALQRAFKEAWWSDWLGDTFGITKNKSLKIKDDEGSLCKTWGENSSLWKKTVRKLTDLRFGDTGQTSNLSSRRLTCTAGAITTSKRLRQRRGWWIRGRFDGRSKSPLSQSDGQTLVTADLRQKVGEILTKCPSCLEIKWNQLESGQDSRKNWIFLDGGGSLC